MDMCPDCGRNIDEHTVAEFKQCLKGGWNFPYTAAPAGTTATVDMSQMAGSIDIKAAALTTELGVFPVIVFVFHNAGGHVTEQALLMDARGLKDVARLISTSVDKACTAARRMR